MSDWVASTAAPPGWSELCVQGEALFHSEKWLTLLERSFPCSQLYFIDEEQWQGAAITQFRAGPFRIGYLGFPVGGLVGNGQVDSVFLESVLKANVAR